MIIIIICVLLTVGLFTLGVFAALEKAAEVSLICFLLGIIVCVLGLYKGIESIDSHDMYKTCKSFGIASLDHPDKGVVHHTICTERVK